MNILEICIPTFNRGDKLNIVLEKLCLLIKEKNIRITILDNNSDETEFIKYSFWPKKNNKIQIIRNKANIGLSANINRCFEVASAEWVWLLGDDDLPNDDAINEIFRAIDEATADIAIIKFSSNYGGVIEKEISKVLQDILEKYREHDAFSNLLFISTTIIKRNFYLNNLELSYKFIHTLAPHLAVIFSSISSKTQLVHYPYYLVQASFGRTENSWDYFYLTSNIRYLNNLSPDGSIGLFLDKIYKFNLNRSIRKLLYDSYKTPNLQIRRDQIANLIGKKTLVKLSIFYFVCAFFSFKMIRSIFSNLVRLLKK